MDSKEKLENMAKLSKRQNTRIESEGAEFLVLGQLLILGIPTYKTYTNMPGYDLIATSPDKHSSCRISVKSRWTTTATGFIIKNFDCDFVVLAKLNRGDKRGKSEIRQPEFFIFPVDVIKNAPGSPGWNRISFGKIPGFKTYKDRWDFISKFLKRR